MSKPDGRPSDDPDERRRKLMARFKGKDTRPELLVRRALHARGLRFRLHRRDLPGTPDIVLPRHRTVVFVHGCFWHQHEGCAVGRPPRSRPEFWSAKFTRNRERDASAASALEAMGWRVLTIWECEAKEATLSEQLDALGLPRTKG
jgi:DNA mismatch endonuclease, patch repair protein